MQVLIHVPVTGPSVPEIGTPIVVSDTSLRIPLVRASTGLSSLDVYVLERSTAAGSWSEIGRSDSLFSGEGYLDSGLTAATDYFYRARAIDVATRQSEWSGVVTENTATGIGTDTTAPPAPTLYPAGVTGTTVQLSWTAVTDPTVSGETTSGLKQYNVRRNGAFIGSSTTTTYTDSPPLGTHTYVVRSEDVAGNKSGDSNEITALVGSPAIDTLDWHPGHYITTDGTMTTTDVSNVCNYANARSYLKGVVIRPFWKDLETSRGVYDFSIIDSALAQLDTGKYLWVQIQTAIFNNAGADAADLVPAYLTTPEFDGGAYDDGTDVKTKIWNAAVMDRKIALIQAMAASYNTTAKFEGVLTGETAMSLATNEGTSNYSPAALATQLQRLCPSARAAFTQKQLGIYVNYISGSGSAQYFQPILEAARSADYVIGGPDSTYLSPTTGRQYVNGDLGTTDYRGIVGIQVGDQTSGLSNTSYNIPNLFSTCFTAAPGGWGANYGFWLYQPNLVNFATIMSYLSSNPTYYVATYPSEFP